MLKRETCPRDLIGMHALRSAPFIGGPQALEGTGGEDQWVKPSRTHDDHFLMVGLASSNLRGEG